MFFLLSFLWFIRETKVILFWLYLWQLKEYHIGRFIDHFRTEKGKQLLFNKLIFLKLILISFLLYYLNLDLWPWQWFQVFYFFLLILVIIYFLESAKGFFDFFKKRLKKPVLTKKTSILISVGLALEFLILFILFQTAEASPWFSWRFAFWLLAFDIFTPLIVSLIVLIFQPLAVLGRNRIIKKAIKKRAKFQDLLVIGITGSYGKTSTKEFLATILSEKYNILKTKEHQNSEVGISQCILDDVKPEHQIFVVEMGAYNRGGIKLLCDIARPKIGILTGINEQHMATFGSLENIIKGKYELIESLPPDGIAFFNAKNKYCLELYQKTKIKKFLYGEGAKLLNEENLLGAMAVAKELGMTDEEVTKAVERIENKLPGIQLKKGINGLNIIDATYSANPDGVIAHLEYLKTLPGNPEGEPPVPYGARKVIVMPCLIELGKASKEVHKRIGQKIGQVCDLAIITTKERFKETKETAGEKTIFLESPKAISKKIKTFCGEGDVILLESRVPAELIQELVINNR